VGGELNADRLGFALFVREGMAAWSSAWASCAVSSPEDDSSPSRGAELPPATAERGALIAVLTSMTLSMLKEIRS